MRLSRFCIAAVALGMIVAAGAGAQTATAPPAHHGLLSRMGRRLRHIPHPMTAASGRIIGNKRTHVFHVAGDNTQLPAPQNRIYFHSVAEAQRGGYRQAGAAHVGGAHRGIGGHHGAGHRPPKNSGARSQSTNRQQ